MRNKHMPQIKIMRITSGFLFTGLAIALFATWDRGTGIILISIGLGILAVDIPTVSNAINKSTDWIDKKMSKFNGKN